MGEVVKQAAGFTPFTGFGLIGGGGFAGMAGMKPIAAPHLYGAKSDPHDPYSMSPGSAVLAAPLAAPAPTDGEDAAARRQAVIAAEIAPTSATSLLTEDADPGGVKRKQLLGE